jgi:threonine aldolase
MRQSGILAAAALIAIDESPKGLAADHANARHLAKRLQVIDGVSVFPVETNIVIFDVSETGLSPKEISAALKQRGVLMNGVNDKLMRAVTHYDVTREQCAEAIDALEEVATAAMARAV